MPDHSRILVVDDESQITRVLRTSLGAQRYDVRVANDGEAALEIMKVRLPQTDEARGALATMDREIRELAKVVSSRPSALAYRMRCADGRVDRRPLPTTYLGAAQPIAAVA